MEDHDAYEDAGEYIHSDRYFRFRELQAIFYPLLATLANRTMEMIRSAVHERWDSARR